MTPETRQEKYLAKASGDYSGELPKPITREEKYLFKIAESGGGGGGDSSEYAHSLELTINSQTYVLTATLKNTSGEILGTPQTIDLPLETMVVGGSYDDTTKKVILTLKNGNTVDFSVADLVSGLQTEITSTNKLNSDLVDDTNQNNKFVTSAEKTKIANALTEEVYNAGKTVAKGTTFVLNDTAYTVGDNAEIFNNYSANKVAGSYSHAEGSDTRALGTSSHAEGRHTTASGDYSHSEGINAIASGNRSHAEGDNTTASGNSSHAEGSYTIAASPRQHVQGRYNIEDTNNKYAFIIGNGNGSTTRSNAFAVDWNGKIYVNNSETGVDVSQLLTEEVYNAGKQVATGNNTGEVFNDYSQNVASGNYSHAECYKATAIGSYSHAEGYSPRAIGSSSHAEGGNTTAKGTASHSEGIDTTASGNYSHAEGRATKATSDYQHVQGKFNVEDSSNKYAFIIGNGTDNDNRSNAFAVDWNGLIYVNNASTGVNVSQLLTEEVYNAGKTTPYGTQYVIAGETYTVGRNAEIFNDYNNNKAIGEYSHAEGNRTTATGSAAHAEGGALLASGTSSHAEGGGTTASGNYSHAEGSNTTASGLIAHAEGEFTNASGRNAHTEGTNTNASGECSHAEGTYTIASSNNQHVQGKYNVEDSSSKYAFIIGNGTANNNRSNAFAVDWNGKIYVNNSETGVDVSDLLARIITLENKVAALENA